MTEKHYLKIEGSGDFGTAHHADAVICVYKDENRWKETIVSDEDGLLDCLPGSATYMSYLTIKDIISYIRKDGKGRFYSVKQITEKEAEEIRAENDLN